MAGRYIPEKNLTLFTVRREFQSRWSNLKWRIDLVYYLKSQQNPVDMAGFYNDPSPSWALANDPPALDICLMSMLIGDVFHPLIKKKG